MDANAQALIARLRNQPDDLDAYEALKAHYYAANDFASLSNLVEGWAARAADPRVAADAFHEAARTVSYYLQDQVRTIELLENALDRDARHGEATADLDALLEALSDVGATVHSLERKAARLAKTSADPHEIAGIHFQIGELWEKSLERPDMAVAHYRTAFELDPEHLPAMYATREIYRQAGDLRTAAQVYELEIAAERSTTRKILLLRELAQLMRDGLADVDGCVSALDRALEQEPRDTEVAYELAGALLTRAASRGETAEATADRRHAAALLVRLALSAEGEGQVAFLEAALDAAPDSDEALTQLERVAPAARAEARLPLRWIRYVSLVADGPHVPERRGKLADAYEAAGQLGDAIACIEPLLARNDAEINKRLVGLYERAGRVDDVQRMRSAELATLPESERIPVLEARLAGVEPGGDEEAALAAQLLSIAPDHAKATEIRLAGMKKSGDHAGLRAHYVAIASDTQRTNETRADAWRAIATLAEGPLADTELALRAQNELLALSPGDRDARAKLKQTMRLGQKWDDLAAILLWEATQETEADLRRNAALSLDELTERAHLDGSRAIDGLARAHADAPDDFAVRDRLLTRLLAAGRTREALPLVEAKAEAAPTAHDKAVLLEQAATIREHQGDLVGSIAVLEKWIAVEPKNAAPFQRALELSERSGDPALLARAVEREADRASGDERARWLLRLAEVRAGQLGQPAAAIDALKLATEAAANDDRIRLELEAALGREGRNAELRDSMNVRVARQPTDDDRSALLRAIAGLSENELADVDGAADAYRRLRAVREDAAALEWLIQHTRRTAATTELATLLSARYELDPDATRKSGTALELAQLLDSEGGDRARAKSLLESVRGLAPDPVPVLEHLARICHADGDAAGLGSAWADLLEHTVDPRRAIELAKSLHQLAETTLKSEALVGKALFHWGKHAPSERAPLEALVAMHLRAGRDREAADALLELGKRIDSPSEAEAKLLEASERYEAAGDLEAAMQATRLAQNVGFGSVVARERLGVVAEKAGRFDVVLEIAEAKSVEASRKPDGRAGYVEALLVCASIARQQMHDAPRAQAYLLKASEVAEGDAALGERVEAAASDLDRASSDAGALLERALVKRLLDRAATEEGEQRLARLTRAVRILVDAIGDFASAYRLLADATVEDASVPLLTLLVEVAQRGALSSDLEKLLQQRFDDSVDPDSARTLLEMRAMLYGRTGRASEEADALQRLFTMRPSPEARDRLLDALGRAGRHQDRVNVLEQAIRRAPADSAERVDLAKRVAHLFETDIANKFEATDAWKRVARWAPGDEEVGAALERLGLKRASMIPPAARSASIPPAAPKPEVASIPAAPKTPSVPPAAPEPKAASLPPPPAAPSVPPPAAPSVPPPRAVPSLPPPRSAPKVPPPPAPVLSATTTPRPDSIIPPPALVPATELAATDDVEEVDEVESIEDSVEELDELVPTAQPTHVRQHVSLPPPPPVPRKP